MPGYSKNRKFVHGPLKEMPDIAYFGCGVPGTNIDEVYKKYVRKGYKYR